MSCLLQLGVIAFGYPGSSPLSDAIRVTAVDGLIGVAAGAIVDNQNGLAFFVLATLVWVMPFMATVWWAHQAERRYYRLYQELHRVQLPIPGEDYFRRYVGEWRFWHAGAAAATFDLFKVLRAQQDNPRLEHARQQYWQRWRVMIAVLFGGSILFMTIWLLTTS